MGSFEDDAWFNDKYAEASCYVHGDADMWYDEDEGGWACGLCDEDDEIAVTVKYV